MRRLCADVRESRRQNAATAMMRLSDEFPLSQSSVHLCDNNDDERRRSAVQPHIISMPSKHPRSAMGWGGGGVATLFPDCIVTASSSSSQAQSMLEC